MAKYAEIEGELQGLSEESAVARLWQAGQSKTCTDGLGHSPARPTLRWVSADAGRAWVLKCGVKRVDLGKGLLLAAWRWPEGTGVRTSAAGNASGGSVDCLGSEAPLLSGTQRAGPPSWASLPTHQHLPLQALGGTPNRVSAHAPVCHSFLPALASVGPRGGSHGSERTHPSHSCLIPLLPEQARAPQLVATCCPSHLSKQVCPVSRCLHPLSSGWEADASRWPTIRGGAETKAEPQGLCN